MPLVLRQTDTVAACGPRTFTPITLSSYPVTCTLSKAPAPYGTTTQYPQTQGSATRAMIMMQSAAGIPGLASWPAGEWTIRLNVTNKNGLLTWLSVDIVRINTACGLVNRIALTNVDISLGTSGTKSFSVTGSPSEGSVDDVIYVVLNVYNASSTTKAIGIRFNADIDTPIPDTAGGQTLVAGLNTLDLQTPFASRLRSVLAKDISLIVPAAQVFTGLVLNDGFRTLALDAPNVGRSIHATPSDITLETPAAAVIYGVRLAPTPLTLSLETPAAVLGGQVGILRYFDGTAWVTIGGPGTTQPLSYTGPPAPQHGQILAAFGNTYSDVAPVAGMIADDNGNISVPDGVTFDGIDVSSCLTNPNPVVEGDLQMEMGSSIVEVDYLRRFVRFQDLASQPPQTYLELQRGEFSYQLVAQSSISDANLDFVPKGTGKVRVVADEICTLTATQTLSAKTLTTPTIASFTNAQHNHQNAAGGGTLDAAAIAAGTLNNDRLDAELKAIAGLTSAADKLPYYTGPGTAALANLTAAGRALIDDADAAAQRATLGLAAVAASGSATDLSTGTLSGARLANKHKTITRAFFIEKPKATDVFNLFFSDFPWTITAVQMMTTAGTVNVNLQHRAKTTPFTASATKVWTADKTASTAHQEFTTFDDGTVAADIHLSVTFASPSADIGNLMMYVLGRIDD